MLDRLTSMRIFRDAATLGSISAAARQGLGVIYQPDFIVTDALARNTLESIRLKELPDSVGGIHVIFNDRYKISARIRATIDFLAEHFD